MITARARRVLTGLILTVLGLGLSGPGQAAPLLFACEPEWAALVRELAGDSVAIYTATTASQDPHHIEARPSLLSAARRADLLVCTGAGLEAGWLPLVLGESGNANIQPGTTGHVLAANAVDMLDVPDHVDRADGDVHPEGNPHVHLDPHNIAAVAKALGDVLVERFPGLASTVRPRQADFLARWSIAVTDWEKRLAPLKGTPVIVHHQNTRYLTHWLGIDTVATLEPKPGVPPGAAHLASVLRAHETTPARMILVASYEDRKAADWLAGKTDLPVRIIPWTVGAAGTDTLFGMFDAITETLLDRAPAHAD